MHNLKYLRENIEKIKKKFQDRNVDFDISDFNKIIYIKINISIA